MSYDRLYYTIGQVSKISGLAQSVLRYWETVFESLNPPKSDGGTRQYTENDVEIVLEIKKLLYDEGYTIKGANKHLASKYKPVDEKKSIIIDEKINSTVTTAQNSIQSLNNSTMKYIKNRINSIIKILEE